MSLLGLRSYIYLQYNIIKKHGLDSFWVCILVTRIDTHVPFPLPIMSIHTFWVVYFSVSVVDTSIQSTRTSVSKYLTGASPSPFWLCPDIDCMQILQKHIYQSIYTYVVIVEYVIKIQVLNVTYTTYVTSITTLWYYCCIFSVQLSSRPLYMY